ncbi:MAG: tetratricopeptide repeat protein, partial [Acidobacteria bacterium]|nr:tetratricopeptide repeat protein [Acidobacteriota bacterium]
PARFAEYVQPRWDEIIRARPDASVGYAYRGSARVRRGETEAGVADLRAALERCPEDAPSLVNLGVALIDLGREAEARPYFDRAIGVDPLLATAFYYRGYVALGERQTDGALADFRRAIELDPGMTEAQRAAASILARAGQLPAAAAVLEDAVLWEPLSAPAWAELGQVYAAMGDTVRARRAQARGEELSR